MRDRGVVPHVTAGRRRRRRRRLARRHAAPANRRAPIASNCEFEPTSTQLIIIADEVTRAGRAKAEPDVAPGAQPRVACEDFVIERPAAVSRTYARGSRSHVGRRRRDSGAAPAGGARRHGRSASPPYLPACVPNINISPRDLRAASPILLDRPPRDRRSRG